MKQGDNVEVFLRVWPLARTFCDKRSNLYSLTHLNIVNL